MTIKSIFTFLIAFVLFYRCSSDPLDVDISNVSLEIKFVNLDSIFYHSNEVELLKQHKLMKKYIPEAYESVLYCLHIPQSDDSVETSAIKKVYANAYMRELSDVLSKRFADLNSEKLQIINGFKYLKYHFPNGKIPEKVVFLNSFFQFNAWSSSKEIAISLERNLNSSDKIIQKLPGQDFPNWVKEAWDRKFLVRDAICSWIMTHYVRPAGNKNEYMDYHWETKASIAENLIRWGKIIYLAKAAMPKLHASDLLRYSFQEYQWALENEVPFWKFLIDQKLLFIKDEVTANNFFNDGPFTPGLPEKGPDRLGQFLGYRIVDKFVEKEDISPAELLDTPYEEILQSYEIE